MEDFRKEEQKQEQTENKILTFIIDNGKEICKIIVAIILGIFFVFFMTNYLNKRAIAETKEEYTTATVVGFDEKTTSRYGRYKTSYFKTYYIELDINGNTIKEENEKLYMTSNIGDVYRIKLVGNFNKYGELIDYEITFIEKVEKDERD